MNNLITQPSLAFGYAQAGQENSFGWSAMATGLTRQVALFAAQAQAGEIQMETLAQAGQWFRSQHALTPPTSVVALDDWQNQGHKTVWYDSRFYRLNVLWANGLFSIRDLHCFDENMASSTYATPLATTYFNYQTLPLMDGSFWSGNGTNSVGMWPVLLSSNGVASSLVPNGLPVVKELDPTDLCIQQPINGGGTFSMVCGETNVTFTGVNGLGQPLNWAWLMVGGTQQASAVQSVSTNAIAYTFYPVSANGGNGPGVSYQLRVSTNSGSCQQLGNGNLQLTPNSSGKLVLMLNAVN
jgi:hypothetical protein